MLLHFKSEPGGGRLNNRTESRIKTLHIALLHRQTADH